MLGAKSASRNPLWTKRGTSSRRWSWSSRPARGSLRLLTENGLIENEDADLGAHIHQRWERRDDGFGDGRERRKTVEKNVRNQDFRPAALPPEMAGEEPSWKAVTQLDCLSCSMQWTMRSAVNGGHEMNEKLAEAAS